MATTEKPNPTIHTTIIKNPETGQSTGAKVEANVPNMFGDVVDFHKKFGIQYDGPPRGRDNELFLFRDLRFHEEIKEVRDAVDANQAAEELDGYVDLVYIILGTCHLRGWDFNEAWRRIHAANMKKVRASKDNPGKYGQLGCKVDIVKPEGWVAPSMQDLVVAKP
ncbi:ntP-ppase-like protein [Caudoviricetes sp.]|nr:ntP-ppase-like protein [Caudoviricetes sp.]